MSSIITLARRPLKNKTTLAGLVIILGILVFVLLGPYFDPYSPSAVTGTANQSPSISHPFGTDYEGHDVMSQVIYGAYPTMILGIIAALASTLIGFAAGVIGGYFNRTTALVYGATDIVLSFPAIVLLVLIGSIFLATNEVIIVGLVIILWATCSRAILPQVASMKKRPYVDAVRLSGLSDWQVVWTVIAPEAASIAIAYFVLIVSTAIVLTTAIEFLGVGNVAQISWGSILYYAQLYGFFAGDWWWVLAPGLMLALTATAFALVGFSIEEALNPRLRR